MCEGCVVGWVGVCVGGGMGCGVFFGGVLFCFVFSFFPYIFVLSLNL